jgi:hypothetical protein
MKEVEEEEAEEEEALASTEADGAAACDAPLLTRARDASPDPEEWFRRQLAAIVAGIAATT